MAAENPIAWNAFELHIENLIPGLLLGVEALALGIPLPFVAATKDNEFVSSIVFIAGSYSIGLLSALVSRALVDSLSEIGPRCWIFELFAHGRRKRLVERLRGDTSFTADLDNEKESRWRFPRCSAEWNAIYRWALRNNQSEEVKRRRAQGRLARGLLFPIAFGAVIALRHWNSTYSPSWLLAVVEFVLVALAMVFVYAYAELMNMAEAYDIKAENPPASTTAT